jgi:diguanylate cyclase (GGDEF)-like protein
MKRTSSDSAVPRRLLRPRPDAEKIISPRLRARRDMLIIIGIVLIACFIIVLDPDRAFEWVTSHKEVQVDEFLTAIVVIGISFGVFSWRRWTDLSRQVAEYQRLQTELSAMNRESSLMSETDDLLQSCISSAEAYNVTIRYFENQFPELHGAIFAITPTRDAVEIAATWGQPTISEGNLAVKDCWALRRGRTNMSQTSDPRLACAHIGSAIPSWAMCVPMMAQGETLGMLYLDTGTSAPAQLTEAQERIVKTLAEHLALAVANLNLRESLRTQSIRDPLTGLFNRRYMEDSMEREFRRATRKHTSVAILMLDVDHFKRFNDSHGHEAGDAVLREMAVLLRGQLRAEDVACRYGGEEFMIVLPDTTLQAASDCAERLRRGTGAARVMHDGKSLEPITLSIGVASYPQHGNTSESVLRAADEALYQAKQSGRDRVISATTAAAAAGGK